MLRLSLAQMRRSAGRLVAAGIAIAIGTAFVAAALFGGSVINATTAQSLTASLGDADVVITGWQDTNEEFLNNVEELPGVEAAFGQMSSFEDINFKGRSEFTIINVPAPVDELEVIKIAEGNAPSGTDEIALASGTAERLGISIGDEVTIPVTQYDFDDEGVADESNDVFTLRVTGITSDPRGACINYDGSALVSAELQRELGGWGSSETTFEQITVAASAGTSADEVKAEIQQIIHADNSNADITVRTSAEQVDSQPQQITGDTKVLLIAVLAFAVVALVVAGLRSEEHTSELQSRGHLVCRLLLEKT